jgi:hypothetical protein
LPQAHLADLIHLPSSRIAARVFRKHNVQLPDEYDQIWKDLGPYRGFAPSELRRRIKYLQTLRDTFSMTNKDGKLTMHSRKYDTNIKGADERAQGQFDFIKDVAKDIPDFEAVFAIHECVRLGCGWAVSIGCQRLTNDARTASTPTQFVSYAHLMELQTAIDEGDCTSCCDDRPAVRDVAD